MNQSERRRYLIQELLNEQKEYSNYSIPEDSQGQKDLLRGLLNVRAPKMLSREFLKIQDEYLKEETEKKGITELADLTPVEQGIYLWQGDITTLRCDAIVNAANSRMTGCYAPNHKCIDNCIHTFAGAQLRYECAQMMKAQGHEEPTGQAKITAAYNLPCRYILHTVGPIIDGRVTEKDCELLAGSYRSCLELAAQNHLESVAFCCISTGEFRFPNELAAQIAIDTVRRYLKETNSKIQVVFNVFKDIDYDIYNKLLG